jgi:hypothetical protein
VLPSTIVVADRPRLQSVVVGGQMQGGECRQGKGGDEEG